MSPQADYVVSNGTGAAVRSNINGQLAAIVSNNSGATAPATTYAYQWWADTTTGLLKIRNSANSAWVTLFELDGTLIASDISLGAGTFGAPSLFFTGDPNTGIYSPGADQIGISTGGTSRIVVDASGNVNIDSGTFYVDAANNRVGIGTTGPNAALDVRSPTTWIGDGTTDAFLQFNQSATAANRWHIGAGSSNALVFYKGTYGSGSDAARIDSSGRLLVGTSSGNANGGILQLTSGITFPATAVAASDANTLDDYEEGTWTPTYTSGLVTGTIIINNAKYTKIGRNVTIQAQINFTAAGGTASLSAKLVLGGLPFSTSGTHGGPTVGGEDSSGGELPWNVASTRINGTAITINATAYPTTALMNRLDLTATYIT